MSNKNDEYEEEYKGLPYTQEELIHYIKSNMNIDEKNYNETKNKINSLQWNSFSITIFKEPIACPRPRLNYRTKTIYVKGASENKKIIKSIISVYNIIYTRTKLIVKTYQKTPINMKPYEILLAEEGLIMPIQNPDWDNFGKTYSDMIQKYLLINDNIVNPGTVEKYFSIRPRVNITISYLEDFDCEYNRNKIIKSKAYKEYIIETISK